MSRRREPSEPPVIPGYHFSSLLGSGGFADVFLYLQDLPQRAVAVKVILAPTLTDEVRERFRSEANLMAQLSHHPSIVTIHQAGITLDRRPYLVLEYCSRPGVGARYRREHISVAESLRVGIRIASATETAHRAGILHRDIKPANVLTTDFGWPALTDFGIASTVAPGSGLTAIGMSVPWSPPEVLAEHPLIDARSDVYSLAATVYSLLAGRSPFEVPGGSNTPADLIARIERAPLSPLSRADVPANLQEVLARGMTKEVSRRFDSALDFARALQQVEASLGLPVTTVELSEITSNIADVQPSAPQLHDDDPYTQIRPIVLIAPDGDSYETSPRDRRRRARVETTSTGQRTPSPPSGPAAWVGSMSADDGFDDATTVGPRADPADVPMPTPIYRPEPHPDHVSGPAMSTPEGAAPYSRANRPDPFGSDARVVQPSRPARRKLGPILGAAFGGLVVIGMLVLIGIAVMNQPKPQPTSDGTTTHGTPPVEAVVPTPTDLTGALDGAGNAVFTWTNPTPEDGDTYLWSQLVVGADPMPNSIDVTTVSIPVEGTDPVCIQVQLVRGNHQVSAKPAQACAE